MNWLRVLFFKQRNCFSSPYTYSVNSLMTHMKYECDSLMLLPLEEGDSSPKPVSTKRLLEESRCCPEPAEFPMQSNIYCC